MWSPRWKGDSNFMPVIAGTGVVPEALKETAAKLRQAFPLHAGDGNLHAH